MKTKSWRRLIRSTNEYNREGYVRNKTGQLCIKRPSINKCGYFYWVVPKKLLPLAAITIKPIDNGDL